MLPKVAASAYIDPSAQVIGDVEIGERASIWANVTLRGDVNRIIIGAESNVQDNSVLHGDIDLPVIVGDRITVGHSVVLHGCVVEDDCLIGMGAIILSGARVGRGSVIAAGALLPEGADIPPGSLVMGSPARVRRPVHPEERERFNRNNQSYVHHGQEYLEGS